MAGFVSAPYLWRVDFVRRLLDLNGRFFCGILENGSWARAKCVLCELSVLRRGCSFGRHAT